jgi:hypothetical protein
MNSRMWIKIKKSFSGTEARFWIPRFVAFGLLTFSFAGWLIADEPRTAADLTAHEWGTFTAVAGPNGRAVEWSPVSGLSDLPRFVEHISDANFKIGLRGTIRMETPVLYFYSPRRMTVSVSVAFSKGVITEWYPHADRVQPGGILRDTNLNRLENDGSIAWNDVTVAPLQGGEFPRELPSNRYYAARETSSAPLSVKTTAGEQQEKFLFYRGVSASSLPLSVGQTPDGKLVIKSLTQEEIPSVILFERRGERVGYRLAGALTNEAVLDPPELTGSIDALCVDLEGVLEDQGLYPDEARAMVQTWRDSWFEEGSRLIYVVPRRFIDDVLPLKIDPTPGQIVRVFVGRFEVLTPATLKAVRTAVACNDQDTLDQYGRFLGTIIEAGQRLPRATPVCRNGR